MKKVLSILTICFMFALSFPAKAPAPTTTIPVPTIEPVVDTQCPEVDTQCPEELTACPVEPTACPEVPTACPRVETECPVVETECPTAPTICTAVETECPELPTVCPVVETECPVDETTCPTAPTICTAVETECPDIPTICPEVPTECPNIPTICPEIPTECPAVLTECPGTECPGTCDPRTQGYWHRQCLGVPASEGGIDPGRNGRGPQEPTEPGFVEDLMPCAEARLEGLGFFGLRTCEGMDADPPSDPCERALKQLTALILNVCSGKLDGSCNVDVSVEGCSATTAGDLIDEVAALINSGDCKQAADCADMVNTGDGLD